MTKPIDDFFTFFFELKRYEIPSTDRIIKGLNPPHSKYNLIQLIRLQTELRFRGDNLHWEI